MSQPARPILHLVDEPLPLPAAGEAPAALRTCCVSVAYGRHVAVRNVELDIVAHRVTAIIGPSGCGKSSFLASLNRLTDLMPGCRVSGTVQFQGIDTRSAEADPVLLRKQIGMIFQKPNPFPMSIEKNLDMPLKEHRMGNREARRDRIETALRDVGLWNEVKDRLHAPAQALSGGQQQRLCIARALVLEPTILLFDEPCSALDPIASGVIEDLIVSLRGRLTQVVVTHNLAQARRIADDVAMFWVRDGSGAMIESGPVETIFQNPHQAETQAYISGVRG